jgi:hypothetical protein
MSIVRKLLDQLDRDALVRLRHLRGLPGGNNNEERRETLARSYRGDVEELIRQLEYNDLIAIFNLKHPLIFKPVIQGPLGEPVA